MGVSLSSNHSHRRSNRHARKPVSDINVTPFVDVMLVLLIIFMVTAPMMTVGVPVDLPKTRANPMEEKTEPLTISITSDGKVFIQETETPLESMVPKLQAITQAKADTRIYVRGDQSLAYGRIMEIMGVLNAAGFVKVALVAELPKAGSPEKRPNKQE